MIGYGDEDPGTARYGLFSGVFAFRTTGRAADGAAAGRGCSRGAIGLV